MEIIYSIRVSYDTPTIPNEKNFAYVESSKFSMLVDHEKNALCDIYIVEFIHDATENYYERGTYAIKVVMIIFIKLVMIMITVFLNITLLMWKQLIVFESLMILPLFRMRRILLMWRVIKFLCL